jgi:hypothetical protein
LLRLRLLADDLTVHRLRPEAALPAGVDTARPLFLVRSSDELSIVCDATVAVDSETSSPGWRCLAVEGPLDFELTGVAAGLTACLAEAGLSVLVMASFDTDFLLLRERDLAPACRALREAGYGVLD